MAGPLTSYFEAASGASDDFSYAELGALGMTFEIGNDFHQDCDYFENNIVQGNIAALTYASKCAHRPFSLSQGPDIIRLEMASQSVGVGMNYSILFDVEASDSAYSKNIPASAQQAIAEIRIYVDVHPYLNPLAEPFETITGTNLSNGTGVATIRLGNMTDPYVGKHTIYAQAVDADGYVGPITARWFTIEAAITNSSGSIPSTEMPTEMPSTMPSVHPPSTGVRSSANATTPPSTNCTDSSTTSNLCGFVRGTLGGKKILCPLVSVQRTCPLTCGICFNG